MERKRGPTAGTLVGESTLHHWAESGRKDVRAKLAEALQDAGRAQGDGSRESTLHRLLYELVWIATNAKLPRQDVVAVFKDAGVADKAFATDALTDLLWIIANEVEANERGRERHSSAEWQNLCRLVKTIAEEELVPALQLKSSLEFDMLHEAGLTESDPVLLAKKVVRINTKTLYTQIKYNLLREETEGFSKVLSLLHTGITHEQLNASKTDLLALIGYFDLDANRVLDLVLDAYEMHPTNDAFVDLLGSFKRESLPHVVGFKFQFYATKPDTGASEPKRTTPRSLYRLAATLLDKKLLVLEDLMPHLSPSRRDVVTDSKKKIVAIQQAARAFGKINLAATKTDDKGDEANKNAVDEDENNQVYGLIIGLLEIGARDMAFEMIGWFQKEGVNPFMYKPLALQLCAMLNALVEDVYAPLSQKKLGLAESAGASPSTANVGQKASQVKAVGKVLVKPAETIDECVSTVFPVVERLGPYLHHDQLLLVKLLRIASHMLATKNAEDKASWQARVKSLIVKAFLPSMSMQTCNPSIAFHVWDLIKSLPFEERYSMYLEWLDAYREHVELRLVEAQVVSSTRGVMRRLTADRARVSSRHLTHFAHSNPLIAFRTMLRQIQSYDNLIQPVVEAFKFITPLGMDALSFVLVSELSKPQKSMKADGTNVSLWLQSLASFSGSFYRKYPNVELVGLLQYLMKRLENWASVDLIVLSELLAKMGSCISLEDISMSQLEAQAGGPHLWQEPPTDPKLQNRRAIPRLRDALVKRDLVLPLCILICQMRSKIEYQEAEPNKMQHLKLLGRVYDTCQMTLSQLLQFMNGVIDPVVYQNMLPSIQVLVRDYHIPAELAMTLCRPAIRCDDPVLRRAPRGVNAPAYSSSGKDGDAEAAKWFMYNPSLLDSVGYALWGHPNEPEPKSSNSIAIKRELYVTFWGLTLYDIHIPFPQYEAEIARLHNLANSQFTPGTSTPMTSTERKRHKEKITQQIEVLRKEQTDQVTHRKRVTERLEQRKGSFFYKPAGAQRPSADDSISELLQLCVIPRALLSPEDALFSAKFVERLHTLSTPLFSTLQFLHKIHLKMTSVVLCATEREAANLGIFLKETLALAHRWYQSGVAYDEDALQGRVGFNLDLNDPTNPDKLVTHKMFKQGYARWHRHAENVYSATLASGKYMSIRNTLVVLTKVIDVFPASKGTAESLLEIVQPLTEEDREDIKIMAKRYFALLTKRKAALVDSSDLSLPRASRTNTTAAGKDADIETHNTEKTSREREEGEDEDELDDDDRDDKNRRRDRPARADRGGKRRDSSPGRTADSINRELESGEIASSEAAAPTSTPPARGASSSRLRRSASNGRSNDLESTRGRPRESDRGAESRRSRDRDRGGRGERGGSADNRDRRENTDTHRGARRDNREASPATSRERERERLGEVSGNERKNGSDSGRRDRSRPRSDRDTSADNGGRSSRSGDKESAQLPPPAPSTSAAPSRSNDAVREREGERGRNRDGGRGGGRDGGRGGGGRDGGRDGGRVDAAQSESKRPRLDAEAVLRRALTEKKALSERQRQSQDKQPEKAKEPSQQEQRDRPRDKAAILDRASGSRLMQEAAAKTDKPGPGASTPTSTGTGTPTGASTGQRKIVSLVSRKREREEQSSANSAADNPTSDLKRGRRDDAGSRDDDFNAGGGGENKRFRDDKRNGVKRKGDGSGGGSGGGSGQPQHQHEDARWQERGNAGRNERRGGNEDQRGGNSNNSSNNSNNNKVRRDKRNKNRR